MSSTKKKTSRELRKFGLTMAVAFAVIGAIFLWRDNIAWQYLFGVSGFFLFTGLLLPRLLKPIELLWMKVAHVLGIVMTYVLLTITYYLVITPIAIILKIIRKDSMNRNFEPDKSSYWIKVDPVGSTNRPDKPY